MKERTYQIFASSENFNCLSVCFGSIWLWSIKSNAFDITNKEQTTKLLISFEFLKDSVQKIVLVVENDVKKPNRMFFKFLIKDLEYFQFIVIFPTLLVMLQ